MFIKIKPENELIKILKYVLIIYFCAYFLQGNAQTSKKDSTLQGFVNLGFGAGIDYGGFGARFTIVPLKRVSIFACGGYNLINMALNVGASFRTLPGKRICPDFSVMYGYNAIIIATSGSWNKVTGKYNKTYYGFSCGFNIELWTKRKFHYLNVGIVYPIRTQEYKDDVAKIKNDLFFKEINDPYTFTISIGIHFILH